MAVPPARIVSPSRSPTTGAASSAAYTCALFSPPAMVATIRPVLPSLLSNSAAAAGGEVHGEVTFSTFGEAASRSTIAVPAVRALSPLAPDGSVIVISICCSLCLNLSESSRAALADSEPGSWKPPAERWLATGMPNTAAATVRIAATARMRRGERMAIRAIRCSTAAILSPVQQTNPSGRNCHHFPKRDSMIP